MFGYTYLKRWEGEERVEREELGEGRVGVVLCQYSASAFKGIVNVTGGLGPEPTHWFLGTLASRVFRLTGRGFTQ